MRNVINLTIFAYVKKIKFGVKMKNKKYVNTIIVCLILSCLLILTSSSNILSSKAILVGVVNEHELDSFDCFGWKWSPVQTVSPESTSSSDFPAITVDSSDNIHVVWTDATNLGSDGSDIDIFYTRYDALTSTWASTDVVSTESDASSNIPSIVVDLLGNVHVTWEDNTDYGGTDKDIFYKYYDCLAEMWSTTEVVSTESSETSTYPSIGVDSLRNIHITWCDYTDYLGSGTDADIFYKRFNASTSMWSTTEVISSISTSNSYIPCLSIDSSDNVHIVWYDSTDYGGSGTDEDILYRGWNSKASTWNLVEVVSTESTLGSRYPSIFIDNSDKIHVTWSDATDYEGSGSDWDIFYKSYTTLTDWTTTEIVSAESSGLSDYPSIAVDPFGIVHIAWSDNSYYAETDPYPDIHYKRREVTSSSWSITEAISLSSTQPALFQDIVADSAGFLYVVWKDYTPNLAGSGSDIDVLYKQFAGPPSSPNLAFVLPNPTELSTVFLDWDDIHTATSYHIYRSSSQIWSLEDAVFIDTVATSDYIDTLPSEGIYYYVIVAENWVGRSSISNCQYIEYKLPTLQEFLMISGMVFGSIVLVSVVTLIKRKNKLN